jgi:hypothetical protein
LRQQEIIAVAKGKQGDVKQLGDDQLLSVPKQHKFTILPPLISTGFRQYLYAIHDIRIRLVYLNAHFRTCDILKSA